MKNIKKKIKNNFVLNTPNNLDGIKANITFSEQPVKKRKIWPLRLASGMCAIIVIAVIIGVNLQNNKISAEAKEAISYLDKSPILKIDDASSFISTTNIVTNDCEVKEIINFQVKIKEKINNVNLMFDYKTIKGNIKKLDKTNFEKRENAMEANISDEKRIIFVGKEETSVFAVFDDIYYTIEEKEGTVKVFIEDAINKYNLFYQCNNNNLEIFESDNEESRYLSLEKSNNNEQIGCYVNNDNRYAISLKNDTYSIYNDNGLKTFNPFGEILPPAHDAFNGGGVKDDFDGFLMKNNRFEERKQENNENKNRINEMLKEWK